jgi:hypothetical protein
MVARIVVFWIAEKIDQLSAISLLYRRVEALVCIGFKPMKNSPIAQMNCMMNQHNGAEELAVCIEEIHTLRLESEEKSTMKTKRIMI